MRLVKLLVPLCAATAMAGPSLAEDAMGSMRMMKGGEVVAIMPDGHMGTMTVSDQAVMGEMMKNAKPLDGCVMIMTGSDGKSYMVDTSSSAAMTACEKTAM